MKLKKGLLFVVMLVLCISLIAVYVSSNGNTSSTDTPPADAPSAKIITPSPVGEKLLRVHRSWEEASWDPAIFRQADDVYLAIQVYESLLKMEEGGDLTPLLAESWEISDNGHKITMKLRQGVQWHHGYGEFTSADVKFTFERHLDEEVGSINAANLNLNNISSIETPDPYTVVFNFTITDVDFLTRCSLYYAYMLSKAAYDDKGIDAMRHFPVGTGAFQYDNGTPGTRTEVVRFADYWGDKAIVDRVTSSIIFDIDTAYAAFENGEFDGMPIFDLDKVIELENKGFTNILVVVPKLRYVGVNMQQEPFTDDKIRAAFWHAIDPQYFVDQLAYGTEHVPGSYIPEGCKYSLPDYHKSVYDPAKSKQLLSEAGFPNGLNVTLWSVNDDQSAPVSQIVYSQLSDAGFIVEMQLVDFGVFIDKVRSGEAPLWVLSNSTPILSDETMNRYTSGFYPGSNWIGLQDSAYDGLVAAGLNAATEQEKYDNFYKAQRYMIDMHLIYPLTTNSNSFMTQPNITGIDLWADSYFRLNTTDIR